MLRAACRHRRHVRRHVHHRLLPAIQTFLAIQAVLAIQCVPLFDAGLLGGAEAPEARSSGAPKVIVVARVGKLLDAEVSPTPGPLAPALWKLATEGVTITRIDPPEGGPARSGPPGSGPPESGGQPDAAAELCRALVPEGAPVVVIDLSSSGAAEAPEPAALKRLHALFGAPPLASATETAAIRELRKALRAPPEPARPAASTRPAAASTPSAAASGRTETGSDLAAIAPSGVTLVRVGAEGSGVEAAASRDALLARILEKAGGSAHVLVLSLPASGPGTLVAAGPRFKTARVIDRRRPVSSVRALVALLLEGASGSARAASEEARLDELFK